MSRSAVSPRGAREASLQRAAKSAKLRGGQGNTTLHTLRRGYGSMLIAQGCDVVYVSRQMGHANPQITLRIYARESGVAEAAAEATRAMDQTFGSIV